ncbi:Hybrid signal transduction histidine kinase J [Lasiodiplodia hormozganensis]|uniref:Hybrid signal transduction histidine kinase J n=1 Tax=Lasiodiplodia hormozganensis TaxID=869390 RepID=A0AA39Z5A7_9PEZI|nr:Hybrid signal transduction histidine kinase J [Lasiodiplodia hormozganensis]
MTGAARTHELRKYSENGQLPLANAACEHPLGWHPALQLQSPLCAALAAFTELVVARLGVFAAFASLTDGRTQRVLAGTWGQTEGHSRDDAPLRWLQTCDADQHVWLSLARRALGLDTHPRDRAFPGGGIAVQLDADRRAANLSCVVRPPHLRYYAAVPIRSRRGICIGTIFVLAREPRFDSFDDDLAFLSSIAAKCMTQLETARESYLKSRITRINDGVCSFIHSRDAGPDEPSTAAPPACNAAAEQAPTTQSVPAAPQTPSANDTKPDAGDGSSAGSGRTTYKEAFARAAAHLRAALDVDGVLFVDGLIGFNGALTPLAKREQELEDEMNQKSGRKDPSKEDPQWTPTPENSGVDSPDDTHTPDDGSGPAERTFTSADFQKSTLVRRPGEILAISVPNPQARPRLKNLSLNPSDRDCLDERFLRKFLARYPSGKIWYFDEDGAPYTFSDGETLVPDDPRGEANQFAAAFRGIRQLIFAPLTDPVTLKRLAGCYAWTTRVHPVFTETADLGAFKGFLHSVEAEVSRIDTVAAIKQQESFVSSVSHELRTPLHGILGAVEFLGETKLDSFQQGLAESIRSCGSTLHDTLSSVLSYSKINQFERRRHKSKHKISEEIKDAVEEPDHDLHGLLTSANIATLCEEVVEVTAGGHTFNKPTSTDDLTITIDVKFQDNWNFLTEPGALRRIMTNILGNALKYTEKGFVKVGLDIEDMSSEPASKSKPGPKLKLIKFSVADSGKGMSKEFLEKHLSVPFTQEDTMASQGVGLGMSIVKSLVAMLGGNIRVQSQLGKGSTFTVSIPMAAGDPKIPSPATVALDKAVPELRQRNLNVAIRGFPHTLQESFEDYLRNWFNCNILAAEDNAQPDVLVVDQAARTLSQDIRSRYQPNSLALLNVSISPSLRRRSDSLDWGFRSRQTISRPIGPHKLSKALLACAESLAEECSSPELPRPVTQRLETSQSHPSRMDVDPTVSPRSKALARAADPIQSLEDLPSPTKRARHYPPDASSPPDLPTYPFRAPSPYQHPPHDSHQSPISPTAPAAALALERSLLSLGSPVQSESTPRLLLVEDNAVNLRLLQTFMLKKGITDAATAENGKVAVEQVAKVAEAGGGFDIIFMDISMPIMDGFEATRAIRAIERRQRITASAPPPAPPPHPPQLSHSVSTPSESESTTPYTTPSTGQDSHQHRRRSSQAFVVALTGLASTKDEDKAYNCGVDLVITKPVKFGKLTELFEKWEKGELKGGSGGGLVDDLVEEESEGGMGVE